MGPLQELQVHCGQAYIDQLYVHAEMLPQVIKSAAKRASLRLQRRQRRRRASSNVVMTSEMRKATEETQLPLQGNRLIVYQCESTVSVPVTVPSEVRNLRKMRNFGQNFSIFAHCHNDY